MSLYTDTFVRSDLLYWALLSGQAVDGIKTVDLVFFFIDRKSADS